MPVISRIVVGTLFILAGCHSPADEPPADVDASVIAVSDADDRRALVVLGGQSNAVGTARVGLLPEELVLTEPYPLPYVAVFGGAANPPVLMDHPAADLGMRATREGQLIFAAELTMGRALDAAAPGRWAIFKDALSSSCLEHWSPTGTYPTLAPPNWFTQWIARTREAERETGSRVAAFVWIQGECDASQETSATRYGERLKTFVAAFHAQFPGVPFVYGRLSRNFSGKYAAIVRAAQDELASEPGFHLVDLDPYPLQSDRIHYTASAFLQMGPAFADAILASVD